jgi:hypothetical protein
MRQKFVKIQVQFDLGPTPQNLKSQAGFQFGSKMPSLDAFGIIRSTLQPIGQVRFRGNLSPRRGRMLGSTGVFRSGAALCFRWHMICFISDGAFRVGSALQQTV